jgi:hypothetical protein
VNLLAAARSQFTVIRRKDPGFVLLESPPDEGGRLLEFWPKGEEESPDPTHWVIETFGPTVRVLDVAGDITSHYLRFYDERTLGFYERFIRSLSAWQHGRLQEQYQYAVDHEGEERPFNTWARIVGMPAYFRGLPFQQGWPRSYYRRGQIDDLARMMLYLRSGHL